MRNCDHPIFARLETHVPGDHIASACCGICNVDLYQFEQNGPWIAMEPSGLSAPEPTYKPTRFGSKKRPGGKDPRLDRIALWVDRQDTEEMHEKNEEESPPWLKK